jgi:metallo-beta-lactamase family protein
VLLVGYQAEGTRGRLLQDGAHEIRFFGKYYPVKATIKSLESLSAHADQADLLNWIDSIKNIPEQVFLVHGEPTVLDAFRVKIEKTCQWHVNVPKLNETITVMV